MVAQYDNIGGMEMFKRIVGLSLAVGAVALATLLAKEMVSTSITINGVAVLAFTLGAIVAGVSLNVWPDKS